MAQPSITLTAQTDEKQLANSVTRGIDSGVRNSVLGKGINTKQMEGGFRLLTDSVKGFDRELDRANRRVLSFGAAATLIYGTVRAFKELVSAGVEVEKSLVAINSIIKLSARDLDAFGKELFDVARQTGQSFRETAAAALEFSRQGKGAAETAKLTRDAMLLVRLTGIDATKAVQGLTAALNTFNNTGIDSTEILNKLVAADDAFAVSAGGLIEAFTRVGSVITDAGASVDEFIGLVTAARQITGRSEAVIGNSLKTIFTRLERSTTLDQLEELGVRVRDASGAARNAYSIFKELGQSYGSLTTEQQKYVAELSAGVFQINQFKALADDLGRANGIAAQATDKAANAANNALVRNAALNKTLDTSIQNLKTSATQAAGILGELTLKPGLDFLLDQGNFLANFLQSLDIKATGDTKAAENIGAYIGESVLKGLGNVLLGPGLILAMKAFTGILLRTTQDALQDLKGATNILDSKALGRALGLGKQEEVTLTNVNSLLSQATQKEQARFIAAKGVAEQEAVILAILERQASVQARLDKVSAVGGLRGGVIPRSAGGYIPMREEAAAISAGIGGAPVSARPVYLPSFNRGGGQRGIVANTSEWMAPTSRGMAIYNRQMIRQMGLPPGSTPVAAGGYAAGGFVPNAAGGIPGGYGGDSYDYSAESAAYLTAQQRAAAERAQAEAQRRMADYLRAQKELADQEATAQKRLADLARQKAADVEKGFAVIDKENRQQQAKKTLTQTELKDAERALAATQQIYTAARERGATIPINRMFAGQSIFPYGPKQPATFAANQAIAPFGSIIPYGPAAPSPAQLAVMNIGRSMANAPSAVFAPASADDIYDPVGKAIRRGVQIAGRQGGSLQVTDTRDAGGLTYDEMLSRRATREENRLYQLDLDKDNKRFKVREELKRVADAQARVERINRIGNGVQLGTIAASFGAAFLPEARGGTTSGQAIGALSYGAQGSAIGAGLGSLAGPQGAIIGAVVGGLGAAITGFLSKSQKSFDELAKEVTDANQRIGTQLENASKVFQLDEAELEMRGNGASPRELARVQLQRARLITSIENPEAQAILQGRGSNPNARSQIQRLLGGQATDVADSGGIRLAANLIQGTPFGAAKLTPEQLKTATSGLSSLFANLSDDDVKKLRGDIASDPMAAFRSLLQRGGVSEAIQSEITKALTPMVDEMQNVFMGQVTVPVKTGRQIVQPLSVDKSRRLQDVLNATLGGIEESGARQTIAAKPVPTLTSRDIQEAADRLARQGGLGIIGPEATLRVNQLAQRVRLDRPNLGAMERLALEGQFSEANIRSQYQINQARMLSGGKVGLIGDLKEAKITNPDALKAIEGVRGISDLQGLLEAGGLPGVSDEMAQTFKQGIKSLILQLEVLEKTQLEDINVTRAQVDIQTTAYQKSLSLQGAREEDEGALKAAIEALTAAQNRREDPAVIAERVAAVTAATLRQAVRENPGLRSQADIRLLRDQLDLDVTARQRRNAAMIGLGRQGSNLVSGSALSAALSDEASIMGQQGNAIGSFTEGFKAPFEGLKKDIRDLSTVGQQVAASLENSLGNAFGDFITGAQRGKDAFRSFAASVANDAARAFASKAVQSLLALAVSYAVGAPAAPVNLGPSGGGVDAPYPVAAGGVIKRASGGDIPAMVMKGEMIFGPAQAKRIGYGQLNAINSGTYQRRAGGGPMMVTGGSGYQDDVRLNLAAGSFVVRKAMVDRYGPSHLSKLAGGGMGPMVSINSSVTDVAQPTQALLRGYSEGGGNASMTAYPESTSWSGGGGVAVSTNITINDQRTTSTSEVSGAGGMNDPKFAAKLARAQKQAILQVIEEQTRTSGMLRIQSLRSST